METNIISYISFNGNAREAMSFYQAAIGGDLTVQNIGDSPIAEHFPVEKHNDVMHSHLTKGQLSLMGSDMAGPEGVQTGTNMTLMLYASSYAEAHEFFEKLSADGTVTMPMGNAFWGGIFGNFTDKFGIQWMVHAGPENS